MIVVNFCRLTVSAVSIECLANASRVQVETGPHFGGRISVDNSSCRVDGSASSNRTRYELVIDHRSCASFVNETSIVSYVVVQESASILTHTARRFVVVCKLVPDAYVVQSRYSYLFIYRVVIHLLFLLFNWASFE